MHYARLYLAFAREHDLQPGGMNTANPEDEIKKHIKSKTSEGFINGHRAVERLRKECASGSRVEYSPINHLEMVCGLLRGQSILAAAAEGIPDRIWSRFDEEQISARLDWETYEKVQRDTSDLEGQFKVAEIDISEMDPTRMRDVWALSRTLLGVAFLQVGDCLVYASALLAEADELLSGDGHVRYVVNGIENPAAYSSSDPDKQAYFEEARNRVIKRVSELIEIDASQVHLPKSPHPRSW